MVRDSERGLLALIFVFSAFSCALAKQPPVDFVRGHFPVLPGQAGWIGPFAGVSGEALIVAGGTLVDTSATSDRILVLTDVDHPWQVQSQTLFAPRTHGSSATWNDSVICLGGKNEERYLPHVTRLRWADGQVRRGRLPDLPRAVAQAAAAVVDGTLYVASGETAEGGPQRNFWALELSDTETSSWRVLAPCPGPARRGAVAAAQDGSFFLFGGRNPGVNEREAISEAYRFTPGVGWTRLADPPSPVAGSPSPGVALGQSHIMLLPRPRGNHDVPPDNAVLLYHTITDTWVGQQPHGSGTARNGQDGDSASVSDTVASLTWPTSAPMTRWRDRAVIVGGRTADGNASSAVSWIEPRRVARGLGHLDWALLALYLAAMVGVGVFFSRKQVHTRSYFLANQRIPWWAAGISIFATSISALTFMAIPALVYQRDWVYFLGNMMIVPIAPVIIYFYLPFYRRLGITSAYEYLEKRFGIGARLVGSSSFLLYQLGRMGIVVYLPALALSAVSGIDVYLCIVVMGVLATLYTALGGIEAVIWTDFIQVIVLVGGALLSFVIIAGQVPDGLAGVVHMGLKANKFHAVNPTWDIATASVWVVVVGNFFKFLIPYSSDQSVVQRYLTTTDEKMAARSIWTNAWLSVPAWFVFFALGTALWAFFKTHPSELDPLSRTDEILPWFIVRELPMGLAGIVIAALFAAAMSSLDSGMNSMATAITTDFYQRFQPSASQRASLWVARAATAVLGVTGTSFAIYMAYLQSASVWNQFLKVMGLFGGGLGGLFMAGIFTRRTSSRGALVGFCASALALYWVQASGAVHFFLYGGIGMFTCLIAGWMAGWILPDRDKNLDGLTVFSVAVADDCRGGVASAPETTSGADQVKE